MEKETAGNTPLDLLSLIALLRKERGALKVKIHLARCGIQKEWGKTEMKWRNLRSMNTGDARRQAEELKESYVRIYQGLLAKDCKLLDQLNNIKQEADSATLQNLRRQVASEIAAMRQSLETLGGAKSIQLQPEEEPVCGCLKCRQDAGPQPFNLDEILAAASR